MSRTANDWAWGLDIKPASLKLLLLSMADRADEDHCCFPSIPRLEKDTGLNRKTIMSSINKLISLGVIKDTGERKGMTRRTKVYKLVGVESDMNQIDGRNLPENKTVPKTESSQKRNHPKNGIIPKTEPSQKRNDTENGTLNSPENGTLNSPENGTQNQSLEPVIEPDKKLIQKKRNSGPEKIPVPDLDFSVLGEITPEQIQMILRIRKSKRANVTQNVLNQLAKQFGLAARNNGLSLQECLDEWEYRGWQAFKAEWLSKPGKGLSLSELNDDTSWIDGMDLDELGFNGV
ncbi:helix-turn-helix domain-containing protein [Vibrio sp. YQ_11]|uniref:helix-turn-helix domain-containing protein n=1 Tax=unclassified Vibrio TaxID=2614977 RepID=UPI00370CA8B2